MKRAAWIGVFGAPAAWAVQHIAGFALALARCPDNTQGPGFHPPDVTLVLGLVAAAIALFSGASAFTAWRATRDNDDDDAPPSGRVHFLAVIGLTITPLFLAMIVLSTTGAIHFEGCAQAAPPTGPPVVTSESGAGLFAANCAMCHGIDGRGRTSGNPSLLAPSLDGVGKQAADFYLRTGYMPLGDALDQPVRARVRFSEPQLRALIGYVGSLGSGPDIPHPANGSVADGRELFTDHCSGCHQVVGEGGVMPGAKAPPLDRATATQIAEAVRIGPYTMPKFTEKAISDEQLDAIVAYVRYARNPRDEGGWGISHLGPFPEGMVTWLIAIVVLIATCVVIGKRRAAS